MIPSFANSAGWNWIGPTLIAEERAVHLRADARQPGQHEQRRCSPPRSCSGSARARGGRRSGGSSRRRTPARPRTTAPARARARGRSGRSAPARSPASSAASGNMYGSASGSRARMNRCASTHRPRKNSAVGERRVADVRRARGEHGREARPPRAATPGCRPNSSRVRADISSRSRRRAGRARARAPGLPRRRGCATGGRARACGACRGDRAAPARRSRTPAGRGRRRTGSSYGMPAVERSRARRRWCRRSRPGDCAT